MHKSTQRPCFTGCEVANAYSRAERLLLRSWIAAVRPIATLQYVDYNVTDFARRCCINQGRGEAVLTFTRNDMAVTL